MNKRNMQLRDVAIRHVGNQGFSIIELLVAMGISLLLLAGVATMFVSSKGAYEINDRLARLEENGRFALEAISREIRAAGYSGCTSNAEPFVAVNNTNNFISPSDPTNAAQQDPSNHIVIALNPPVVGFNYSSPGSWVPALNANIPAPSDGSDVLLTQGPVAGFVPLQLQASMALDTDPIQIAPVATGSGPITNHQLLMIGDCTSRSYFEVTSYTPSTGKVLHASLAAVPGSYNGNWTSRLGKAYQSATTAGVDGMGGVANIYRTQTTVFYVAPSTNQPTPAVNPPYTSLWRKVDSNAAEELIEGVDSLQFLYGLDTDGDGIIDTYSPTAANPSQILSVTVSILVRSLDEYGTVANSNTYDLLGPSDPSAIFIAPGDRRMRQVFTTTVWARNPST